MNESPHPAVDRQGDTVPSSAPTGAVGRVLVIDDDDAVGLVLSRALARLGVRADITCDGARGLSRFEAEPAAYGLVLLDYKLPGMDSGTVYRSLRSKRPDLPVVLMSGYKREEILANYPGLEFAGFLNKPFTMDSLAEALRLAAS
jgi:CheY-like chemotaxis protein